MSDKLQTPVIVKDSPLDVLGIFIVGEIVSDVHELIDHRTSFVHVQRRDLGERKYNEDDLHSAAIRLFVKENGLTTGKSADKSDSRMGYRFSFARIMVIDQENNRYKYMVSGEVDEKIDPATWTCVLYDSEDEAIGIITGEL